MRSVLNTYKAVGQSVNRQMNSRSSNLLMNCKPCIGQTPGRIQYFRAENEPFLTGKKPMVVLTLLYRRGQVENFDAGADRHQRARP